MSDDSYRKLAKVLDTLPNGFPPTESGLEIRLLEKIFEPEEAELVCDLRLTFETPEQIAERTGRPLEGLKETLLSMWRKGPDHGSRSRRHGDLQDGSVGRRDLRVPGRPNGSGARRDVRRVLRALRRAVPGQEAPRHAKHPHRPGPVPGASGPALRPRVRDHRRRAVLHGERLHLQEGAEAPGQRL